MKAALEEMPGDTTQRRPRRSSSGVGIGRPELSRFGARVRGVRLPRADRHKTNSVMPTKSTTMATPKSSMREV